MPAQSPEEQAFSKASQASCSLPSLRETAPRMFHTRYDLSSRRKASSRSLRAPAVFPCWSRQIPPREIGLRGGFKPDGFRQIIEGVVGVPELAQGQPAADQRLWVIGLDFQCFVKVFQRFFRVGTRLAFPKDMCFCEKLFGLRVMLARHARGVGGLGGHLFRLQQRTAGQREDGQQGQPSRNRPESDRIDFIYKLI